MQWKAAHLQDDEDVLLLGKPLAYDIKPYLSIDKFVYFKIHSINEKCK